MAMRIPFQLAGGFDRDIDAYVNPEDTINMYVVAPGDGVAPVLVPTPGMRLALELPQGEKGRASFYSEKDNKLYKVISQFVYRIDTALNYSVIGTLTSDTGPVGISANNNGQIIFLDGSAGFIWDIDANTFTQITDSNLPASPSSVGFDDGYFLVPDGDTNEWQISDLNDGTSWDPTMNAFMESRPATIIAIGVVKQSVFIFGNYQTEVWYDSPGTSTFPYVRDNNLLFEYGLAAERSLAQGLDILMWLGQNDDGVASVMFSDGGQPQIVSTAEVDNAIAQYTAQFGQSAVSDATAFIYKENGHTFYQLNFTQANASWLYDLTTDLWFRLEMLDGSRHKAESHAYFNGQHYVTAYNDPNIYILDPLYNSNGDESIRRERTTQKFSDPMGAYRKVRVNEIEFRVLQGQGTANGVDKEPFIELYVSPDGGRTYGKTHKIMLGQQGNFNERVRFKRLGIAQEFAFNIRCYNAINFTIVGASIDFDIVSA